MDCATYPGPDFDALGPFGIDYIHLHDCTFPHGTGVLFFMCIFIWIALCMSLLSTTASNYFSPTLGNICEKLNMPYDVAGVTFLAFGNAAPDFFSLLASFTGDVDVLVGVGALLGGSVFITTVVVGAIAIFCPCEVVKLVFLRDISFHLVAIACVALTIVIQDVTIAMAVGLIVMYALYVVLVASSSLLQAPTAGDGSSSSSSSSSAEGGIETSIMNNSGIQTAFWHKDAVNAMSNNSNTNKYIKREPAAATSNRKYYESLEDPSATGNNNNINTSRSNKHGYSFVIEDDDDEYDENDDNNEKGREGFSSSSNFSSKVRDGDINLSSGFAPAFNLIIDEDYCSNAPFAQSHTSPPPSRDDSLFGQANDEICLMGNINESLLGDCSASGEADKMRQGYLSNFMRRKGGARSRSQSQYSDLVTSLYWQQWILVRRHRHGFLSIPADWQNQSTFSRAITLMEMPFSLVRDLTIPTLDQDSWSKLLAILQPFAIPLFTVLALGLWRSESSGQKAEILLLPSLLGGALPAFLLFLFTHHNRPPASLLFATVWLLIAFFMCVMWIYVLAGELITCLSACGKLLHLPPAFVGLTVLAWGNSVGDFFANTAVARRGFGEMAIAGCYGGPVFNILMGLGCSLLYGSIQTYPKPFSFRVDASTVVSIVFLFVILLSTVAIVVLSNYRIKQECGIYLITMYVIYTAVQTIVLLASS